MIEIGVTLLLAARAVFAQSTTSSAALVVPTSFAGTDWGYVGCWSDPPSSGSNAHVLTSAYSASQTNTQESCLRTCNAGGWGYAGLVYGEQCICGNVLSSLALEQDESKCNKACTGDATGTSTCGGTYTMSLFRNPKLLAAAGASGSSSAATSTTAAQATSSTATSASPTPTTSSRFSTSVRSSTTAVAPESTSAVPVVRSSSAAAASSASASASAAAAGTGALASSGGGTSKGAVAGGVIGGLAVLIGGIVAFVLFKRKKKQNAQYDDRPRNSFVGGTGGSGGSGREGWARGASVEDDDGMAAAGAGFAGVGAGAARNGGRKEPSGFESGSAEKIGMEELPVVPISSPHHPANAYPQQPQYPHHPQQTQPQHNQYQYDYPQHSQHPPAYPPSYPPNSHPHMLAAAAGIPHHEDATEHLARDVKTPSTGSSPSSSPPTAFTSSMQNSSSSTQLADPFTTVGPPRRPSETSSSSHGGPPALGRVVSVTRKNRKPVPVLAPEEVDDAYDGLAYDDPAPAASSTSSPGTAAPGTRDSFVGGEWDGAKQMKPLGVDLPLEQPR